MIDLMYDVVDLHALYFKSLFLDIMTTLKFKEIHQPEYFVILQDLKNWRGDFDQDKYEPTIYSIWEIMLLRR